MSRICAACGRPRHDPAFHRPAVTQYDDDKKPVSSDWWNPELFVWRNQAGAGVVCSNLRLAVTGRFVHRERLKEENARARDPMTRAQTEPWHPTARTRARRRSRLLEGVRLR